MIIHHEAEIKKVMKKAGAQQSKKQVFESCYSSSKGAARRCKLEKAWKRLRELGTIVMTPSKRYSLAAV